MGEYDKTLKEIDMEVAMSKAYFSANPSADKYKSTADVLKALRTELAEFPTKFKDKLPADDEKQLAAKFAALAEKLPAFDEEHHMPVHRGLTHGMGSASPVSSG